MFFLISQRLVQHQPARFRLVELIDDAWDYAWNFREHKFAPTVRNGYYAQVDAVVYLVDASDKERFAESKRELDALLSDESLANVPFLILGDWFSVSCGVRRGLVSFDMFRIMLSPKWAPSEDELLDGLTLRRFTTCKGEVNPLYPNKRPFEVFMCSIVHKRGYKEAF